MGELDPRTTPQLSTFFDFYLREYRDFADAGRPQARELDAGERPEARSSSLGSCLLSQWMQGKGVPKARGEFDAKTLRNFENGDMVSERIVRAMQRLGLVRFGPDVSGGETRLHDDELGLSGHVDLILGWPPETVDQIPEDVIANFSTDWISFLERMRHTLGETFSALPDGALILEELKTTHSNALKYLFKEGEAKFPHRIQGGSYKLMGERNPEQLPGPIGLTRVTYIGKDAFGMLSFEVTDKDAELARKRAQVLKIAWEDDKEPRCDCECACPNRMAGKHIRSCQGWQVEYCAYGMLVEETPTTLKFQCCENAVYLRDKKAAEK